MSSRTRSTTNPQAPGEPERADIRWVDGVSPTPDLAARRWGDRPSELAHAVERRDSGLLVEIWRDAATVFGRNVDLEVIYELDTLIGIQIVGLTDAELEQLGFRNVQAEDGLVVKTLGDTLWIADLLDRLLRLEPDPERTDAGLV